MSLRLVSAARLLLVTAVASCGGTSSDDHPSDASTEDTTKLDGESTSNGDGDSAAEIDADAGAEGDVDAGGVAVTTSVITSDHRFVDGKMFGGWGPHLGHLLRRAAPDELWFADDACTQSGGADVCDVNVNRRIDYLRLDSAGWTHVDAQPLPAGVQQNTGSLLSGDVIFTYGVDISQSKLVECTRDLTSGAKTCAALAFPLGASANYVGAAITPAGAKVVWLTNVKDGGGGQFQYFVDYGGGWNGPRIGGIGGYNDASYIHVAFGTGARSDEMLMHAQFITGLAPAWSFFAGVGTASLSTTDPVAWSMALADPTASDPVFSTDDVAIDPVTNDAHLVARTKSGAAAYYHRPAGGAFSVALWTTPNAFRARLVFTDDGTLHLVYGPTSKGLAVRSVPSSARVAGAAIDWTTFVEHAVSLPAGYESIDAIYPQSSVYQSAKVKGLRLAVVGATRQSEALFVSIGP